jgi:hypothetical protein
MIKTFKSAGMFFRQVLHEDLGCASYVVADGREAAVIDPKWEIEDYLELAEEHDFRIAHVLETHNHADHVSGHGRLAASSGARIYISAEAGVEYQHAPLADGESVAVGDIQVTAQAFGSTNAFAPFTRVTLAGYPPEEREFVRATYGSFPYVLPYSTSIVAAVALIALVAGAFRLPDVGALVRLVLWFLVVVGYGAFAFEPVAT